MEIMKNNDLEENAMFGYVRPNRMEMKLKDINRYSSYYCALCDQIGRDYGILSRFLLSYDVTFLLICLDSLFQEGKEQRKVRCPYNILQTKTVTVAPQALRYAAFINYWLVVQKLADDYYDDESRWKFWVGKFLASRRKYKSVKKEFYEQADELSILLRDVYEKEQKLEDEVDFDEATNTFGTFFAKLFQMDLTGLTPGMDIELLRKLLFQMGKWIYIVDAYDDFQKDVQKNRGNLLYALNHGEPPEKMVVFEMVYMMYLQIRRKIIRLLQNPGRQQPDDCIVNIVTYGIDETFEQVTRKKYREFAGRVKGNGTVSLEQLAAKDR